VVVRLVDVIPDADALCALEPDELGLRMLPVLAASQPRTPQHTSQQLTLPTFIQSVLGLPNQPSGQYPAERYVEIDEAIREAWAWLVGSALLVSHPYWKDPVRRLSRRAQQLAQEPNPRRVLSARRIPKDSLHPMIREDVWSLYHRGKYDTAVFEAMKAVEVGVREAAGLTAADIGKDLMRKAFDVKSGRLTDMTTEPAERQARSDLFAGAIGSYKNPHSHRNIYLDDPDEAAEIIMMASHLLRIVEARLMACGSP
jgi:uncharacterized protein (TIGR02391 family)